MDMVRIVSVMLTETDPMVLMLLAGTLLASLWLAFGLLENSIRYEAEEAKDARKFLDRHFDALELLLAEPVVPAGMKAFLKATSDVFASREFVESLRHETLTAPGALQDRTASQFLEELENMQRARPDLSSAVDDVVLGGVLAAVHWRPGTNYQQRRMLAEVTSRAERAALADYVARVAAFMRDHYPKPVAG